jgi:hypothetical protein
MQKLDRILISHDVSLSHALFWTTSSGNSLRSFTIYIVIYSNRQHEVCILPYRSKNSTVIKQSFCYVYRDCEMYMLRRQSFPWIEKESLVPKSKWTKQKAYDQYETLNGWPAAFWAYFRC